MVTAFATSCFYFFEGPFFFFFSLTNLLSNSNKGPRTNIARMAPPKQQKMPSMKELQDLLAALDAEGGLAIGGGDGKYLIDTFTMSMLRGKEVSGAGHKKSASRRRELRGC